MRLCGGIFVCTEIAALDFLRVLRRPWSSALQGCLLINFGWQLLTKRRELTRRGGLLAHPGRTPPAATLGSRCKCAVTCIFDFKVLVEAWSQGVVRGRSFSFLSQTKLFPCEMQ